MTDDKVWILNAGADADVLARVVRSGDRVECRRVYVGRAPHPETWVSGFTFSRIDGNEAVVRRTIGACAGMETRYPVTHVRLEQSR